MKATHAITGTIRRSVTCNSADRLSAPAHPRRSVLAHCLVAALAIGGHEPAATATNLWRITDCGDDGGSGTLRFALTYAIDGDIVALAASSCSVITLTQGEIVASANNLSISNYVAPIPVIDAGHNGRAIRHTGTGTLALHLVDVANGKYIAPDELNPGGGCVYSAGTVYLDGASLSGCEVTANAGTAVGGAVSASTVIVSYGVVAGNAAYSTQGLALGGGINAVNVVMHGGRVYNNTVRGYDVARGGGISANGFTYDLAVYSSIVSGNRAIATSTSANSYATGGGLSSANPIVLLDSRVEGNSLTAAAGTAIGGGAFGHGITMAESTISGNHIDAAGSSGGGIFVSGDAFVTYSTIDHNQSFNNGGLVLTGNSTASAVIWNTTISSNVAQASSAMFVSIPLQLSNSTIAFNRAAGSSAGLYLYPGGTTDLHSVPIADNTSSAGGGFDLVTRAGVQGDHNLIRNPASGAPPDTIVGTDPELGPLADYGGPTRTHAMLHTSVAIDAGSNDTPGVDDDQRGNGFPRVFGAAADIGAWEWQGGPDDPIFAGNFDPGGG